MTTSILDRLDALPLVAILRGLTPEEAVDVGEALLEGGFTCLEVPLNSPRPLESIRRLRDALGDRAVVGAGTVLTPEAVREVVEARGQLIISPNADADVIRESVAVGGVTPDNLAGWRAAGASGFGIGGALFKPGMTATEVGERARAFVSAWRAVQG